MAIRITEFAIVAGDLMGHAIALILALRGHSVRITDTAAGAQARVQILMKSALASLQEAGAAPEGRDAERLVRAVRVEAKLGMAEALDPMASKLFATGLRICRNWAGLRMAKAKPAEA